MLEKGSKKTALALICTISVWNGKPAFIYDLWEGSYFAPMNWKIQSGKIHEWSWLSSLDYRSKQEVAFIADYGNIDQGTSQGVSHSEWIVVQRPALYRWKNYGKYHSRVQYTEDRPFDIY